MRRTSITSLQKTPEAIKAVDTEHYLSMQAIAWGEFHEKESDIGKLGDYHVIDDKTGVIDIRSPDGEEGFVFGFRLELGSGYDKLVEARESLLKSEGYNTKFVRISNDSSRDYASVRYWRGRS